MRELYTLHSQLNQLMGYPDVQEKHKQMFEALSGEGIVSDHEVPDKLTRNQTISIALEYIDRLYKGTGNG